MDIKNERVKRAKHNDEILNQSKRRFRFCNLWFEYNISM